MANKLDSIKNRWKEDSENFSISFSDEKQNLSKDTIENLLDKINNIENKIKNRNLSKSEKEELKNQISSLNNQIKKKVNNKHSIEQLDDQIQSKENITLQEVLNEIVQIENNALELILILLEMIQTKDAKKVVNIINEKNNHIKIYKKMLDKVE